MLYPHFFSSPAAGTTFFFAFCLAFALLLSRFFNPDIPALHTSAYLLKNPSRASAATTVERRTLDLCLPSVARMRRLRGCVGARSGNDGASAGVGKVEEGAVYVTSKC